MAGNGAGGIYPRLAVIRKLMQEAADNMVLYQIFLACILVVKGARIEGKRLESRLTLQTQLDKLVYTPDVNTLKGLRDWAILAVLSGCWLRRNESFQA